MKIGKWSIIVPDKRIVKQYGDGQTWGYLIEDDGFWKNNLNSNIRAVQYTGDNSDLDQVEFNDGTPHTYFTGNIQNFADKWDEQHLLRLQQDWDFNNEYINLGKTDPNKPDQDQYRPETQEEKITRLGPKPTSYSSIDIE
jgi:hypothetical protein